MTDKVLMVKCDLCGMRFNIYDSLYDKRIEIHNTWHNKARIQKRNTTQGNPTYTKCVI